MIRLALEEVMKAQRRSNGQLYFFFDLGARWGWVDKATPRPLYPLYRNLGRPRNRSGQVQKISPSPRPGFDCRTVRPVAIPCTGDALLAHVLCCYRVSWYSDRIECNIQGDYELVTRSDPSCSLLVYDTV